MGANATPESIHSLASGRDRFLETCFSAPIIETTRLESYHPDFPSRRFLHPRNDTTRSDSLLNSRLEVFVSANYTAADTNITKDQLEREFFVACDVNASAQRPHEFRRTGASGWLVQIPLALLIGDFRCAEIQADDVSDRGWLRLRSRSRTRHSLG